MSHERPRPSIRGIYLVTDSALCNGRDGILRTVDAAVRAGVSAVQVRDPRASTRELATLAEALTTALATAAAHVPLIVNDRVDVALAVGAAGVHVGQSDLDPLSARRLLGPDRHLGVSVSNLDELAALGSLPEGTVDLLGVGPIRDTSSKPDAAPALGFEGLRRLCAATTLPCVAIGGLGVADLAAVVDAGAVGVAVISAICGRPDPAAAATELVTAWTAHSAAPAGRGGAGHAQRAGHIAHAGHAAHAEALRA